MNDADIRAKASRFGADEGKRPRSPCRRSRRRSRSKCSGRPSRSLIRSLLPFRRRRSLSSGQRTDGLTAKRTNANLRQSMDFDHRWKFNGETHGKGCWPVLSVKFSPFSLRRYSSAPPSEKKGPCCQPSSYSICLWRSS